MPRYETRSSQFGLVSGIRQSSGDMVLVVEPAALFAPEARKGQLYIVAEADQDLARGRDACQTVIRTIRKQFYEDSSYSVTSALRKALSAANKALYQHNFGVMAQKRAFVGVTCAVLKGNDLFIAQIAPTQAYVLAEGKLRALPTNLSWNSAAASTTPFFKPAALGGSLSIEPEFYRAVLRPGDALLLCSSNLSRLLGREEVMRLLRQPDPADITEGLLELCRQNALPEAHGIAVTAVSPLSPAAQASPLSRSGVSERGALVMRTIGGWATRASGEAVLMFKGPLERARRRRAAARREQEREEIEQLSRLPQEPRLTTERPPMPVPLDLGATLDEQVELERQGRRARLGAPQTRPREDGGLPPSAFLGEGGYLPAPQPERRIDLSDTPGMAALGRHSRSTGGETFNPDATIGERLAQPFTRVAGAFASMGRRRRLQRPPPSAMPPRRRQEGLSYRRQRPPFPWRLLLTLVLLVALLIVYGNNLLRENALQETEDKFAEAQQAVMAVRDAPDDATAQLRLDAAAAMLNEVRPLLEQASSDNRRLYEELQREYERDLAAIQKLTYFDDLTQIATHPTAGGVFSSVVVPPPPQGITNTAAFESLYLLDANAGVLYQMPRAGGPLQPFLKPDDTVGPVVVGKIKAQAWRIDNIVAVAQSGETGPFTFYFRGEGDWRYSNLAGSDVWGGVEERLRIANYDGNLYVWGAAKGQVLKYFSGNYGDFPVPWIQNDGGNKLDTAVGMAIDGRIYLLRPDGHILVFDQNQFVSEITPQGINPPLVTVANFFVTGDTPETGSFFLVDTYNGRIIQLDKQSGALIQQISARPDNSLALNQLTGVFVDESAARPVLYLINGGQVLRASLPDRPQPFRTEPTPAPTAVGD